MKIMVEQQPMKVAAAEAHYTTSENAAFSILSVGDLSGDTATTIIEIPGPALVPGHRLVERP